MSKQKPIKTGTVTWFDLTVPAATQTRDFYRAVTGWQSTGCDMGGYEDYAMTPRGAAEPVAGICHARGANADLPAQWLIYINVKSLATSIRKCRALGGEVIAGPRGLMGGRFCVIRDPAGAVAALYQPPKE